MAGARRLPHTLPSLRSSDGRDRSLFENDENPYLYAHVFLVCWESADKRFHNELDDLDRTFREDLNFVTHLFKIPDGRSLAVLTRKLLEFLEYDGPETLLVLYYGGHGSSNSDNDLIWRLDSTGDPSVNWTCLQQHVFDKESDVLLILDCCSAASAIRERQNGRVESLMGCGIQDKTPIDGDYCFTRKLSRKLRDHSSKHGITAYDIYHQLLQEYNKAGPERNGKGKDPVYAKPGKQLERTIWLRRMESFRTAKSTMQANRRGAARSQSTVEIINTIEHPDTCEPNGDHAPSVLSMQTTRSMATIYHSILNETGERNWSTEETVFLESLEDLHFIDTVDYHESENHDGHSHRGATRFGKEPSQTGNSIYPSPATKSLFPLINQNEAVIKEVLKSTPPSAFERGAGTRGILMRYIRSRVRHYDGRYTPDFYTVSPISASDIFEWQATIKGPPDTPYEGGIFHICLSLTGIEYPRRPPRVWFHTKVYHPNINEKGAICADFLGRMWTSAYAMEEIVLSLVILLQDPCLEDPLMPDIAKQAKDDPAGFERTAREWTRLYATGRVHM